MSARLLRGQVAHHVEALGSRAGLTALQAARLAAIVDTMGEDGRFRLRDALVAAEFPAGDARGQDAFQDFRKKVNQAAAAAGIELALELDSRKVPPDQRFGWFTGGDLVDESIASFTDAAGRTGIEHPIDQTVLELDHAATEFGRPRPTRVYVSFPEDAARLVKPLLTRLREVLALDADQSWDVVDGASVGLGEDPDAGRDQLCAQADVRIALVTPAYLAPGARERSRVLNCPGPVVVFALSGLPDSPSALAPLRLHRLKWRKQPWDELRSTGQRRQYIDDLADAIRDAIQPRPGVAIGGVAIGDRSPVDPLTEWNRPLMEWNRRVVRSRPGGSKGLVEPDLTEIRLEESHLDRSDHTSGNAVKAVERLVEWATDSGRQRLCALLGDVGMGKTTTAKLFTQRLLDLREGGERGPLPILFDLRDVRVGNLAESMTLDHILTTMLDANRPPGAANDRLTADVVRRRVSLGDAVVVFDGLDEVLVHLTPHDQRVFTRQLWRAVDEESGSKMLLTCRTQYFRTIREETSYFLGEERQGLRGENYLALLMLPFRDDQVREYLATNLGRDESWVDGFLATMAGVHNLPELARRPLTLQLIADQVEFIETAKLAGRTLRSVDLYREFVDRWLHRDSAKHSLQPEHKQILMEQFAAGLWRSGKNSWGPAQVEDWLLDALDQRPDIQRHYRERVPDLWKADFRTATFLSRDGDSFSFGHRSLFEYFLACYLCRALTETSATAARVFESWAMPVPGPETLDFLGQSIAGLPDEQRSVALHALKPTTTEYVPQTSELALAYALRAAERGHPHQSLVGVQLPGAQLEGWIIGSNDTQTGDSRSRPRLSLAGANLAGAALRRTTFHQVDLTRADLSGADLTNAEAHGSRLTSVRLSGARATGTILRECEIDGVELTDATSYRAQLLRCTPPPAHTTGWLVAPLPDHAGRPLSESAGLRLLAGHTGPVGSVAYSPDGTRLLSSGDGSVWVWDATSGEPLHHLSAHTDWVGSVAYSPDGTRLLSGGADGSVWVWDASTGEPLHHLSAHTDWVGSVAYSPDGTQLLSGGSDGSVRVWDATTGKPLHHLTGHTDWVGSVAYSPDGTQLLSGGSDGSVRVWDASTGETLHHLTGHTDTVWSVAYSPDGTRLLSGSTDGSVRVWDATTGETLHHLSAHINWVWSVAYSPDGTRLLSGGADGSVRVWDATTGEPLHNLTGHTGWVRSVAYSPNGTQLLSGSTDGSVRVWDASTGEPLHHLTGHTDTVWSVAYSPDGTRLLSSGDDGSVRVWDASTGKPLHHLTGHTDTVWSVAYSPDGTRLLSGAADGSVRVWDATTGKPLHHLTGHTDTVWPVAHSPDGTRLLSSGDDGSVRIWDATTGETLHHLRGHTDWVWSVAYSPDGTRLLSGSADGSVRVWDATTGKPLHHLTGHTGWVWSVAYSPDGTRLLSGGADGSVRIWDATTGETLHHLTGHTGPVGSVTYSPNGTHLVSGSADGSIRVWDATTGEPVGFTIVTLPGGELAVFDAVYQTLAGASAGAWRWLGWNVVQDGRLTRLPAETYGILPPLVVR